MTEHLSECWAKHDSDPAAWCICEELRACEERVLGDRDELVGVTALRAFRAGLDAAREAVRDAQRKVPLDPLSDNWRTDIEHRLDIINVIDALRGQKP